MKIGEGREITGDLFGVAARLKAIDPAYVLWRSYKYKRFELHSVHGDRDTLELAIPFDRLDERTVRLALSTRRERADKLYEQIERENRRLEAARIDESVRSAARETERILSAL